MADENLEKQMIKAPVLPNVVQGDGRYVMALLKDFLQSATNQINLSNGFSAEDIAPGEAGDYPTPANFTLSFNRLGGLLVWDHIKDVTFLLYYELRTNANIGNANGLLDRTVDNSSYKMSAYYSDTLYLYAVSKENKHSNPSILNYTKPRPEAPRDISLTKNNEGTLITFLEIPLNCIGANIYINDVKYQTVDNIFLFQPDYKQYIIKRVEIAYYDNFGEGERAVINCIIPDVKSFYVEKNGANLDFYWEPIDVYSVRYVVKVAQEASWDMGIEVFTTKINRHRYIYPNEGSFYFLIKAVDEHNNYSVNAAWYNIVANKEIDKNVILSFKEIDRGYSGNKINLYYDVLSSGLKLEKGVFSGEYLFDIELDKRYRARNWTEFKVVGITNTSMKWVDMDFTIDSDLAKRVRVGGGIASNIDNVVVKKEISRYVGDIDSSSVFAAELNSSLDVLGGSILESVKTDDYRMSKWNNGLFLSDTSRLAFAFENPIYEKFSLLFWLKNTEMLANTILFTLRKTNAEYFLCLGYSVFKKSFYLVDSYDKKIDLKLDASKRNWLMFGICQSVHMRQLFIYSLNDNKVLSNKADFVPVGEFDSIYCYPKINF